MLKIACQLLALASVLTPTVVSAAQFADSVIAYSPGTGFATEFGSGQGFTNAAAALGEPSRSTPGQFGGPVDPFSPPYLKEQLVSVGAGGSLTVGLSTPILDSATHRFGLDFIVYGNSGFVITNADFTGGGITDGSLFGGNSGATRVSVSADNVTYFTLDPARAPVVDTLFPTDGSGSFDLAIDPALGSSDFGGKGLAGIRALYDGSGGGTGFDLAWALDANGQAANVTEVRFIRIDVLTGVAEIDGIATPGVVPEPATSALLAGGLAALGLWQLRQRRHRRQRSHQQQGRL